MFKNWTTQKTVITLVVIFLIVAFFAGWFGETLSYKGLTSRANGTGTAYGNASGARGPRKTECVGGYVTYLGITSNIPCSTR